MEKGGASPRFGIYDYLVLTATVGFSLLLGLYYAWAKNRPKTSAEYMLGGKTMKIFPITMSMIASHVTGVLFLGMPSEIYRYGTQIAVYGISTLVGCVFMSLAIIPVFYEMQIISSYEYLNRRFSRHVRTLGSFLFIVKTITVIPIVIIVPALAFAQVSGIGVDVLTPTFCLACIFYTAFGGVRAIIWTDTLQVTFTYFALIIISILGTMTFETFNEIWERNEQGGRLEFFNFSWDPRIRHTFWSVLIGKFFQQVAKLMIDQSMTQRCCALQSLRYAKISVVLFGIGLIAVFLCFIYIGLLVFATYWDCDPLTIGQIESADQILPFFILQKFGHIPAINGIFIAGNFGAALSSMSTGLNLMSYVVLEDFIKPMCRSDFSDAKATLILKLTTIVLGIITMTIASFIGGLGGLIQTQGCMGGITEGTILGLFLLGMFSPWANTKGAVVGALCSGTFMAWMSIGSQVAISRKQLIFPKKPTSIDGCFTNTTEVISNLRTMTVDDSYPALNDLFFIYQISYTYYALIGVIIVVLIGSFVSWLSGPQAIENVDPVLFSPLIQRYVLKKIHKSQHREGVKHEENLDHLLETSVKHA